MSNILCLEKVLLRWYLIFQLPESQLPPYDQEEKSPERTETYSPQSPTETNSYKVSSNQKAAAEGVSLKLKLTKNHTHSNNQQHGKDNWGIEVKDGCQSEGAVSDYLPNSDGEESDWKPNEDTKNTLQRKKRKQTNPRKVVKNKRGRPKKSNTPKGEFRKIIRRRWISKLEKRYKCQTCRQTFPYRSLLLIHCRKHGVSKPKSQCYFSSRRMIELTEGSQGKDYRCKLCDNSYKLWTIAEQHMRKTHGRLFPCRECTFSSTSVTRLHLHAARRHGADPHLPTSVLFRCNKCPRTFKHCKNFLNHIKNVHNPSMRCENCLRYVRPTYARQKHLVACYRIGSTRTLTNHNTTKPINLEPTKAEMCCDRCGRVFKYQKAYSKHLSRPCSNTHVATRSEGKVGKKSHDCVKCHEQFPTVRLLQEHRRKEHGETLHRPHRIRRP